MEQTPNKRQHTKLTLEKKILPPLLPEFELATFFYHESGALSVGTCEENEFTRNSPKNGRPQSSQLAKPLWIDFERVNIVRVS